jgi:hypothetical protein
MVTDAVVDWFFDLVDWLMGLGTGMTSGMPRELLDFSFMGDMNYFLPVAEMFALFSAFFLLGGPMMGFSLIVWFLVGVLRGGQSKS